MNCLSSYSLRKEISIFLTGLDYYFYYKFRLFSLSLSLENIYELIYTRNLIITMQINEDFNWENNQSVVIDLFQWI